MFTFVGSYMFNEKKTKTLYKLLLTVNFKLVVMDLIMTCLLLLGLTHLMNFKLVVTDIIMTCLLLSGLTRLMRKKIFIQASTNS